MYYIVIFYVHSDPLSPSHVNPLEMIIKELQGVVQTMTLSNDKTKEELEKEKAVKAELLSLNSQLQTQLDEMTKELAEVKKHAHEPTPEAIEEKGQ